MPTAIDCSSFCLLASLVARFPPSPKTACFARCNSAPILGGSDEVLPRHETEAPARTPVANTDETLGTALPSRQHLLRLSAQRLRRQDDRRRRPGLRARGVDEKFGPLSALRHAYYNAWDPATQGFIYNHANRGVPVETVVARRLSPRRPSAPPAGPSPLSHTLRAGPDSREHAEGAMDTQPGGGMFSAGRGPMRLTQSGQPLELIWPKIALSSDSTLHMVTTENPRGIAPNTPRRIFYSRGVPQWNGGQGVRINWQNVDGPRQFLGIGTSQTVSADIAASRTSQRVAIAWTQSRDNHSQYNNDVYLRISEDGGPELARGHQRHRLHRRRHAARLHRRQRALRRRRHAPRRLHHRLSE